MVGYIVMGGILMASIYTALRNRRKKEERERLARENQDRQKQQLKGVLASVGAFNTDFEHFMGRRDYLAHYDIYTFVQRHHALYKDVKSRSYKHLSDFGDEIRLLDNFCS